MTAPVVTASGDTPAQRDLRVLQGASLTFGGMMFHLALSFVSGLFVARVLGPAAYGVFSVTRTLCDTANLFTKAGLDIGIVRYLGEHHGRAAPRRVARFLRRALGLVMVLASLPVLMLWAGGAGLLQEHAYHYAGFAAAMTGMALSLPFMAVTQVLGGMFRGVQQLMPRVAAELVLQPALRLVLILALFAVGWRLDAVIAATVASYAAAALFLYILARRTFLRMEPGHDEEAPGPELVHVCRYSIVIALTTSVAALLHKADLLMIGYYLSASDTGCYAVAQMLVGLLAIFNGAFNQMLAPLVASHHRDGNAAALGVIIHQHTRWVLLTTFPLFALITAFGAQLLPVFGAEFHIGTGVVALLAVSQLLVALSSSSGFLLSMTGKHRVELYAMAFGLIANVALNVILIPRQGLFGAALATCIAMVAANLLRAGLAFTHHRIAPLYRSLLAPLAVSALTAVALAAALALRAPQGWIELVLVSTAFVVMYFALTWKFALTPDDRATLTLFAQRLGVGRRAPCALP